MAGSRSKGAVLHAARYRTRCSGCKGLLKEGMPIFMLDGGWGCYRCHLEEEGTAEQERSGSRMEEAIHTMVEDVALSIRTPDRCGTPARRLQRPVTDEGARSAARAPAPMPAVALDPRWRGLLNWHAGS